MIYQKPFKWLKAISEGKFFFFLVFLLLFIGFSPLLCRLLPFRRVYDLSLTAVMFAGIYAVREHRRQSIIAAIFALPMLLFMWVQPYGLQYVGLISGILFVGYAIALMVGAVLKARNVTTDVICAAVSAYLLMGLLWSLAFGLLQKIQPQAFSVSFATPYIGLYYSFVTLTTLGYGDISPLTPDARALSILEAVVGQLYLAVLVARLVGIYISQELMAKETDESSKDRG